MGTRVLLGDDRVDDAILRHVHDSGRSLYFPADFEPLPEESLILDVGAHSGIYAVEVLRRNPASRLIAVEPNPVVCRRLRANVAENGMAGRVEVVQAGLGAHAGTGLLHFPEGFSWGGRTVPLAPDSKSPKGGVGQAGLEIAMVTVADVLKGRAPHLVKLNAEGAEFDVIPALFGLGVFPALMILMVHPALGNADQLVDLVTRNGYSVTDADRPPKQARFHCRRLSR